MAQHNSHSTIQSLYPHPIPDTEANEAASSLIAFMKLLIEIDCEHHITRPSTQGAQS